MADNYVEAISTLDKLYSLLERRLEQAGNSLPCTMEALHIYASSPRSDIDYLDLINLDNQSLFYSVYMITASNIPRSDYVELWEERIKSLPKEKFHMEFMNAFVSWPEFSAYHVRLKNCIYVDADFHSKRDVMFVRKLTFRIYRMLKPIYLQLPDNIRQALKLRFRKYVFG